MAKPKKEKTLDNETFKWIEEQNPRRCLKCPGAGVDWASKPMRITCPKKGHPLKAWGDVCSVKPGRPLEVNRRRQRYFSIRNVAHKEIDDLTKLAEVLPDKQANQIFTVDHLKGLASALLQDPVGFPFPDRAPLYLERARIAQLFIKYGFDYLSGMNSSMMTLPHKNTMEEAIDLSRFLLETFPSKWPYYSEVHGKTRSQGPEEK
jgi:hypothetical protein